MLSLKMPSLRMRNIILLIVAIVFFAVIFFLYIQHKQESKLPPRELLNTALENTWKADSFRFHIQTEITRNDTVSSINGKREAPDRIYLKGKLQDTPLELVYIGGTTYLKESGTENWFKLKGNEMINSELFAMEINPLGSFNFDKIKEISREGKEKIEGKKLTHLKLRPELSNEIFSNRYKGFEYNIWIDPGKKLIRRATISGTGLEEGDNIYIGIELWDYNKEIQISPPEVDNNSGDNQTPGE